MERLQTAMEKARAQREQSSSSAPKPRRQATSDTEQAHAPEAQREVWQALKEISTTGDKQLHSKRITTFAGSVDSAPFDLLRTRMLQQARQNNWKRIAIVSPHSGCGKSTVAANLAFGLSRQSHLYSMIFDFDLRRAGISKIMEQHLATSMVDVLQGQVSFAEHGRRMGENVALGFNGGLKAKNPSEILQHSQTSQVLNDIDAEYAPDIMLFDMPPLMASDDNFGFLENVDCALILAAAEQTSMSQIDVAERHVAELTNVMGIVLNKCRYTAGAYGHEYDYY